MSKKDVFIKIVQAEIFDKEEEFAAKYGNEFTEALTYLTALKGAVDKEKPAFTDNGKLIITYMQAQRKIGASMFKASELGAGIGITSRTASGAMRKLVTDGYVEKLGENPTIYSLTDKGVNVVIDPPSAEEE